MISAPGIASASASDRAVLPVAVAPAMTMSGGKEFSAGVSGVGHCPRERVRAGTLDADID